MGTRAEVVKIAKSYKGCKKGSAKHHNLVDVFNSEKPHGEVGNYTCPWCAITWTAVMLMAGMDQKHAPHSYNCGRLVSDAQKIGAWVENDAYVPSPGDGIIYNWSDSGSGDCKSGADHVGIVVSVSGKTIKMIEGNKSTTNACGEREIKVNSRYIRGYIVPKYEDAKPVAPSKPDAKPTYVIGKTYTIKAKSGLNVRKGAGKSYEIKKVKDVSDDAKQHCTSKKSSDYATLKNGTRVTCMAIKGNWMKIPSGWICCKEGSDVYIK